MEIKFSPIGYINTPFKTSDEAPRQGRLRNGSIGKIQILKEYQDGLKDLDGFSHIVALFHFDRSIGYELLTRPKKDTIKRGVFATRSPFRPNGIGLTILKLLAVKRGEISVEGVDMIDQTPVLDIKPFIPKLDPIENIRVGWLEKFHK